MAGDDSERQVKNGWVFPAGVTPPDTGWFRMKFGDTTVYGLDWNTHVHLAHAHGLTVVDVEIVDSGVDDDGIRYVAAKTTVKTEDGAFSALGSADEVSQQVRDPEHVWTVAESRSIKRAVKKALDIRPADEQTAAATADEAPADEVDANDIDIDPENQEVKMDPNSGPDGDKEW